MNFKLHKKCINGILLSQILNAIMYQINNHKHSRATRLLTDTKHNNLIMISYSKQDGLKIRKARSNYKYNILGYSKDIYNSIRPALEETYENLDVNYINQAYHRNIQAIQHSNLSKKDKAKKITDLTNGVKQIRFESDAIGAMLCEPDYLDDPETTQAGVKIVREDIKSFEDNVLHVVKDSCFYDTNDLSHNFKYSKTKINKLIHQKKLPVIMFNNVIDDTGEIHWYKKDGKYWRASNSSVHNRNFGKTRPARMISGITYYKWRKTVRLSKQYYKKYYKCNRRQLLQIAVSQAVGLHQFKKKTKKLTQDKNNTQYNLSMFAINPLYLDKASDDKKLEKYDAFCYQMAYGINLNMKSRLPF